MSVNSVSSANTAETAEPKKKLSAAQKGAAAGIGYTMANYATFAANKNIRDVFVGNIKEAVEAGVSKTKIGAEIVIGVATAFTLMAGLGALVGKGIGAIANKVKAHNENKTEKA